MHIQFCGHGKNCLKTIHSDIMDVEHDSFKPYELTKLPIVQKMLILINYDCSKTLPNTYASLDGPICEQIACFHSINVSE